jgi:hypothetical protein
MNIAAELFEFLSVERDKGEFEVIRTGEDTINGLDKKSLLDSTKKSKSNKYKALLQERMGFESVEMITNFPVTTLSYGYTRRRPEPSADLNLFGYEDKTKIFAKRNDSEAVFIKLDFDKLKQWLQSNGISIEGDMKAWLIKNIDPPSQFDEVGVEEDRETYYVYTLLHTLSHSIIQSLGKLSGYSQQGFSEKLFPRTGSFVVYRKPQSDFNLGAMMTTFETRFDKICEFVQRMDTCERDPICSNEESHSCESCLYTSYGCSNSNNNLSREILFGSVSDGDLDGYFDI